LREIEGIDTYYGLSQALFDIDLTLSQGEIVCLLGRVASANGNRRGGLRTTNASGCPSRLRHGFGIASVVESVLKKRDRRFQPSVPRLAVDAELHVDEEDLNRS
jgi:hypothetical protein